MLSIGDRAEAEIAANLHGMVLLHLECSHAKVTHHMPPQPIMSIGKSNRGSDVGHGAWLCCAHVLPRGQTSSLDEWQCQLINFTTVIITFFRTYSGMMMRLQFRGVTCQECLETAGNLEKQTECCVHSRRLHVIAARPSGKESATVGRVELPGHSSERGVE